MTHISLQLGFRIYYPRMGLRDPIPPDLHSDEMIPVYSCMFTALLLHFDLSVAAAVCWMGGTHTSPHRDHHFILSTLDSAGVDVSIIAGLRRIYFDGAPAYINAESSEANLTNYFEFGNRKTIYEDSPKTKRAMSKDVQRGYNLVADSRLSLLIPHLHPTPISMVDLNKIYKEPRPIFDSSFRPEPSSIWLSTIGLTLLMSRTYISLSPSCVSAFGFTI